MLHRWAGRHGPGWPLVALALACLLAAPGRAGAQEALCQDGLDNDGDTFTDGADVDCQCLLAATGISGCTANDTKLSLIGLGDALDGCINPTDQVEINLFARLEIGAVTRYDLGMWVNLDGGSAVTGAVCTRQILVPVSAASYDPCNPLGTGPFRDPDGGGDLCGEASKNDVCNVTPPYHAYYQFPYSIKVPCLNSRNGFLDMSRCLSWNQNAGVDCFSLSDARPGTSSKCNCLEAGTDANTDVPGPNLQFGGPCMSCDKTILKFGETATCTLAYTNTIAGTCSATAPPNEWKGCGTAAYVRYVVDYNEARYKINSMSSTRGTRRNEGGVIDWLPASTTYGTTGIVGPGNTDTLSFVIESIYHGSSVTDAMTTSTYWKSTAYSAPGVGLPYSGGASQSSLTCSLNLTTPVTLSSFEAMSSGGKLDIRWTTATEAGNAGFNLYAETDGELHRLNAEIIASNAVDSVDPQAYSYQVGAKGLENARFYVEDVSTLDQVRRHGPFEAGRRAGMVDSAEKVDWKGIAADHDASEERRRPDEAAEWADRKSRLLRGSGSGRGALGSLLVDKEGLYRATHEQLLAAGLDLSGAKLDRLVLRNKGLPVPMRVAGGTGRGKTFGPGSFVEFHGDSLDTLYTGTNVYELGIENKLSARAGTDPGVAKGSPAAYYMDTVRLERERAYSFASPNGDPWYDSRLIGRPGNPSESSFDVAVDRYVSGVAPASVVVGLWGMTDWPGSPDHHVVVGWNGTELANEIFDGVEDRPVRATLPDGALREGTNTLAIRLPGDTGMSYDIVVFDNLAVTYPRAFVARGDRLTFVPASGERFLVEGFSSPNVVAYRAGQAGALTLLSGVKVKQSAGGYSADVPGTRGKATYYLSTVEAMRTPGIAAARDGTGILKGSAQYLILSHPDFIPGLQPLVSAREAQGLQVRVVDVRDVYAIFGNGIFDAQAIKDYVSYAATSLKTKYVLLVGGDTYDYRNFLGTGSLSFVPSVYGRTDPVVAFAPLDPLYADRNGDGTPDVAIGRFPVRTAAELDSLVARTLDYGRKGYGRTAVFAADAYDANAQKSFSVMSDDLILALPTGWAGSATKAYMDDLGLSGARQSLIAAINRGTALTSYVGHSAPTMWSFQSLFKSADAEALTNGRAPTVVVQWGCWNTYYVAATYESLANKLLLSGDRGAAAVLGATTLTSVEHDLALGEIVTPLLANPGETIGKAVLEAKKRLWRTGKEMPDVLLGWTLLGDPALVVAP